MQKEEVQEQKEAKETVDQDRPGLQMLKGKFGKENFLIVALVGVLLLVIAWPVEDTKKVTQSVQLDSKSNTIDIQADSQGNTAFGSGDSSVTDTDSISVYAEYLEDSLEKLLSTMEGVGKVRVMVTLEGTGETVIEKDLSTRKNSSTEVDSAGGSRNSSDITEEEATVFFEAADGNSPVVRQMKAPKVAGVAVSAQGGGNAVTAGNIKQAIQALFGIDAHKIIIVKMISQ